MSFIACGALSLFLPLLGVKSFENHLNKNEKVNHRPTHHNNHLQNKPRRAFPTKNSIQQYPISYYYPNNLLVKNQFPSIITAQEFYQSYTVTLIDLLKYAKKSEPKKYTFNNYRVIQKEVPKGDLKMPYKLNNKRYLIEEYFEKIT